MGVESLVRSENYRIRPSTALATLRFALRKFKLASIEICCIEGFLRKTLVIKTGRDNKKLLMRKRIDGGFDIFINKKRFSFKSPVCSQIVYERTDGGNPIVGRGLTHENPNDKKLLRITRSEVFLADLDFLIFTIFDGEIPIEKDPTSEKEYPFCFWRIKQAVK